MNLQERVNLLIKLGEYMRSESSEWDAIKDSAGYHNGWFIRSFVDLATNEIATNYLQKDVLTTWAESYQLSTFDVVPKRIGIVMAGNLPLVGFHDLLCVFISGHHAIIKPSSKDEVLIRHVVAKLIEWNDDVAALIVFSSMLKDCDAYIATGSNNTAGYFDYYFSKYPHIIRRNRTSVAVLSGNETQGELELLADDVYLYFGRGCRNVTKLFVPEGYDFIPLIANFKKYDPLAEEQKYKNNYDYNLAIHLLNKTYFMSNDSLLLIEDQNIFTPIGQLNYEYYNDAREVENKLSTNTDVQCIIGAGHLAFGKAQSPLLNDYADGVDTMTLLLSL